MATDADQAYLPGDQKLHTPEFVRISATAAHTLGLQYDEQLRNLACSCIEILQTYPEGCAASCAYCGFMHGAKLPLSENSYLQNRWQRYATSLIMQKIVERDAHGGLGRVCIEQIVHHRAAVDLLNLVRLVRHATPRTSISTLIIPDPVDEHDLLALREAGVDIIGLSLDAASANVFARTRGQGTRSPHTWDGHWRVARLARRIFGPFRVNLHVIVGLGETDHALVELFYQLREEQIACSLFAFNPEPGSLLQDASQAPLHRHRRIQLVKFLIERRDLPRQALSFDDQGAISLLDAPKTMVEAAIAIGQPFMTEGCPDRRGALSCTRSYGSYHPSEPFRDYPFPPSISDVGAIRAELRLEEIRPGGLDSSRG